jgi:hypothetical protein
LAKEYDPGLGKMSGEGFCVLGNDFWVCGGYREFAYAEVTISPGINAFRGIATGTVSALLRYTDKMMALASNWIWRLVLGERSSIVSFSRKLASRRKFKLLLRLSKKEPPDHSFSDGLERVERHLGRPPEENEKIETRVTQLLAEQRQTDRGQGEPLGPRASGPNRQQQVGRWQKKAELIDQWLAENQSKQGAAGREKQSNITDNDSATMMTSTASSQNIL